MAHLRRAVEWSGKKRSFVDFVWTETPQQVRLRRTPSCRGNKEETAVFPNCGEKGRKQLSIYNSGRGSSSVSNCPPGTVPGSTQVSGIYLVSLVSNFRDIAGFPLPALMLLRAHFI